MNKLLIIIFSLFLMVSCQKEQVPKDDTSDLIDYPNYTIEDYNKMDTYVFDETIDGVKYRYTYFFDDEMCVNSKEELTFKDNNSAKEFYDEIKDLDDYLNVTLNNRVITYYNNPEYFIYMMYPKELLIEMLTEYDDIEE